MHQNFQGDGHEEADSGDRRSRRASERPLFAQSLVGTWQGPMQVSQTPGDILRVVFKIAQAGPGTGI
jgi:hypothetical protein